LPCSCIPVISIRPSLTDHIQQDKEFEEVYKKVTAGNDSCSFEQFTNYMVSITEDKTTPEQLRQSFLVIAGNKKYVTETDMRVGQLTAEQVQYLKTVLPPKEGVEGGYDYESYLKSAFSN
jgi:hypothetical protein